MATKKTGKKGKAKQEQISIELPDLGLNARQLARLTKAFENELVATMGEREAIEPVRKFVIKRQVRKPVIV